MPHRLIKSTILATVLPLTFSAIANEMTTQQAVSQLHLSELAQTYNASKIAKATQQQSTSAEDALMIDIGAITVQDLKNTHQLAHKLSAYVADQLNTSEHYLGNVRDENIVERLQNAWQRADVLTNPTRLSELNKLIDKGYTTGYNVINKTDQSHFNPALTIRYGHNNMQHAVQLIDLMRSEGFDPKVQLVPKASAFLYLPEWGRSSYPVTTLASGKMVAVMKEYNLDFEFKTQHRKAQFMGLINHYAKKDRKDEKGLIFESWWQPFYRSYTPMKHYQELDENRVDFGHYEAQLMVLHQQAKTQADNIRHIMQAKNTVKTVKTWVNPSFYRYMHGDYK